VYLRERRRGTQETRDGMAACGMEEAGMEAWRSRKGDGGMFV